MILMLFAMIAAVSVSAQSRPEMSVKIPFDFIVGQKTLPAGEYRIRRFTRDSDTGLLVQSADGRQSKTFITSGGRVNAEYEAKLIFHKYGDQYFLSQVLTPWVAIGRELPESQPERSLEDEIAKNGLAEATNKRADRQIVMLTGH